VQGRVFASRLSRRGTGSITSKFEESAYGGCNELSPFTSATFPVQSSVPAGERYGRKKSNSLSRLPAERAESPGCNCLRPRTDFGVFARMMAELFRRAPKRVPRFVEARKRVLKSNRTMRSYKGPGRVYHLLSNASSKRPAMSIAFKFAAYIYIYQVYEVECYARRVPLGTRSLS